MSLLALFRPSGVVVVTPPSPDVPVAQGHGVPSHLIKKPELVYFEAGTATIRLRAIQTSLLLLTPAERARLRMRAAEHEYVLELESQIQKQQRTYRAVRDDRRDEEFERLVEAAYLLSRRPK